MAVYKSNFARRRINQAMRYGAGMLTAAAFPYKRPNTGGRAVTRKKATKKLKLKGEQKVYVPLSSTMQRRKNKKTRVTGNGTPGAMRTTRQILKMGPGKYVKKQITYHHSWQGVVGNSQGTQVVDYISCIWPRLSDNTTTGLAMLKNRREDYGSNLYELLPSYTITPGTSQQPSTSTGIGPYIADPKNGRKILHLNSIKSMLSVTNHSNIAATVTIYWCAPVKDCPDNPLTSWTKSTLASRYNQSQVAINPTGASGVGTVSTAAAGYTNVYDVPDFTPMMFSEFKKYWNIKKTNILKLAPGNIEDIETTIYYGKKYSQFKDENETDNSQYYTGFTLVPMVVVKAQPIIISQTTPFVLETTYGETQIGFIHKQILNIGFVDDEQMKLFRTFSGTAINSGIGGRFINEEGNPDQDKDAQDVGGF